MAKKKVYAVKKGRKTGIFTTWAECQKQVSGFPKAEFKSFISKQEADDWLKEIKSSNENRRRSYSVIVYTDGGSRNHGNKKGEIIENTTDLWHSVQLLQYLVQVFILQELGMIDLSEQKEFNQINKI